MVARETGELIEWNDDRGFGFIQVGRERLFVHIKAIKRIATRPRIGDRVSFERGAGRGGKPRAINVQIAGANPVDRSAQYRGLPTPPPRGGPSRMIAAVGLTVMLLLAIVAGKAPFWLPLVYLCMGLLSVTLYRADKARAEADAWRISEANLHLADAFGGIIGGLLAQQVFRHKTSKSGFALVSFAIAIMHGLLLAVFAAGLMTQSELARLLPLLTG